jgi:hypothetical protein
MTRFYLQRAMYKAIMADFADRNSYLWKNRHAGQRAGVYAWLFWRAHDGKSTEADVTSKQAYTAIRAGQAARRQST